MATNKKSVLLYCDIIHTVEELSNEEAGILFKHYLRYVNDLNPKPPDKITQIVFEPIKQNLKRDLKKWEAKSERNSDIAKAAWRKRNDANAYERMQKQANEADKVIVTDKVTDKDINMASVVKNEKTIVGRMKAIWLKRNPRYQIEDDNDCPALLSLAYKIAKVKGWEQKDVVNGKLEQTAEIWDAVVGFIRKDDFYKKLALVTIDKQWTGLVQSMAAAKEKNRQQLNTPVKRIKSQAEIDAEAELWLNED